MLTSFSPSGILRKDRATATTARDILPELFVYEDTGCEVSASCLNCPLPRCKHDDPGWFQRYRRLSKDMQVLTVMGRDGLTVEETAERFSITVRTVFRALQRCREAIPEMEALAA